MSINSLNSNTQEHAHFFDFNESSEKQKKKILFLIKYYYLHEDGFFNYLDQNESINMYEEKNDGSINSNMKQLENDVNVLKIIKTAHKMYNNPKIKLYKFLILFQQFISYKLQLLDTDEIKNEIIDDKDFILTMNGVKKLFDTIIINIHTPYNFKFEKLKINKLYNIYCKYFSYKFILEKNGYVGVHKTGGVHKTKRIKKKKLCPNNFRRSRPMRKR